MRSWVPLVFAVLLPGLLFAGGGKEGENPVAIQLWHRYSGVNESTIREVVSVFEKRNPDVKVDIVSRPGEYIDLFQKMFAEIAAGNPPPDLFIGGYELMDYIYSDLNPTMISDLAPNPGAYQAFADKYLPGMLDLGQVRGDQMGVPLGISSFVMYYNEDIFKAAGLTDQDVPKTWDDVIRVGKIIKDRTGKYAIAIWKGTVTSDMALVFSNGGQMLSDDGTRVAFSNREMVDALSVWQTINRLGLEPVGTTDEDMANFIAGDVAMFVEVSSLMGYIADSVDFNLKVAEFPSFGSKRKAIAVGGGLIMSFTKDQAKYNAAWRFLDFLTGPEAMTIMSRTGRLCPTTAEVPIFPGQEVAYAQLEFSVSRPSWPGGVLGLEIDRLYLAKRTEIIRGTMDVAAALEQLERNCNRLLTYQTVFQ
ncbi:extracellular solute-binding protein [Breznakiella homolactica]|uniref:Extracellular solute-binding protein n=1 Tax=Breznakiella homolactica TaxID=2798577 RepID=A0A7T8BAI0_9SPIR|nr:extracellular solute-binding protein [Breznakiella homolactica]QQO10699.1 extracellular solute-binding protein [Breznakiella homolactica]